MSQKRKPYVDYTSGLDKRLKDRSYAAKYLNAVLRDHEADEFAFLLALADVARAHGISQVAEKAHLHRVAVHKMLQEKKDPRFSSLLRILKAVHLELLVQPQRIAA